MMKLKRGDVFCRKCKHTYRNHCVFVFVSHGDLGLNLIKPLDIVPCNGSDMMGGTMCGCVDYEPLDNLEYLEWKADLKDNKTIDDTTW